ncbi:MAG TPA: RDD family protein, partial [Rhodospirillales bacterium]|nr:RDD family protein [Rhodospirillales bacterium]
AFPSHTQKQIDKYTACSPLLPLLFFSSVLLQPVTTQYNPLYNPLDSCTTRATTTGMLERKTLGDIIEALEPLKLKAPSPLLSKSEENILSLPLANRWTRYFARIFDIYWQVGVISIVASYMLSTYSAGFVEWINGPVDILFGIMCLPFALVLDAFIYKVIGNTPGKAILGLSVATLKGKPLGLGQYLGRNLLLWVSGLAFGIPLINLITFVNQSIRLGKGKQTSYDELTGYRVHAKQSGWWRIPVFIIVFFFLFLVTAVLNRVWQEMQGDMILNLIRIS